MNEVNGIDLDLILEDLAYTKKRVSELEDNQVTILTFLDRNFPRKSDKIKRILRKKEERETVKPKACSAFGQEDTGLTTEEAVRRCFVSKPVSSDPILKEVGISGTKDKVRIPASLRG
jgi:tRNA C32,U32 (ribose-2'-O)-methylase TrmJ